MEEGGYGLLDNDAPPPNACRIKRDGSTGKFPIEIPDALRDIMEEGEFVDYITRVNEAAHVSGKIYLLILVPQILMPLIPVAGITTGLQYLIGICGAIWFISSVATGFILVCVSSRRTKEAKTKVENLVAQINQRMYPRGIRWDLVIDTNGIISCIDIVQFDPSAAEDGSSYEAPAQTPYPNTSAPFKSIDTQFQSSSIYIMQTYPPSTTAPLIHHPSAPPSSTTPYQFAQTNTSEDPSPNYPGGTPLLLSIIMSNE